MDTQVICALEAMKEASKDIENAAGDGGGLDSPSTKALLELESGADDLFADNPKLSRLSNLLSHLKELVLSLKSRRNGLRGYLQRRELARVARLVGAELQAWIDRESAGRLVWVLRAAVGEAEKAAALGALEERVSRGFEAGLQEALLRSGTYAAVEGALSGPGAVGERAAEAVLALARFNRAVFVGPVMMGPAAAAMVAMGSPAALWSLRGLVTCIKSPLVDELHAQGHIPPIIALMSSGEAETRAAALELVLEIGYYGRKEAIEAMLEGGVIKRLVSLQRTDLGGGGEGWRWENCVGRFAVQLEVGEGLRTTERRALKLEILQRVREAVSSETEAATLIAEVLWGSTCW